ncbi:VanZ family protein [Microbacterium sp. PA5]|uniref:VanZ family protein n=1 Tax=Microbacterium sp. PA5 TaxID=3416654 RepID=UPI003CFA0607
MLLVPFVAVSYRRRGRVGLRRTLVWAAALVYGWAIWTYTLLPLPDPTNIVCVGTNTNLFEFVDDISGAWARAAGSPLHALTDTAVLQLALNVLLFVPLGFFLRILGGRGVVVAGVAGLLLSALIETTQLTGVWGLYPCAYRVFDVDDMLTNTTGAALGSILALAVPSRFRGGARPVNQRPHPVTKGRRLLAMLCDWVALTLIGGAVATGVQSYLLYVAGDAAAVADGRFGSLTGGVAAVALFLIVLLISGRSIGDIAVMLRYSGSSLRPLLARLLRFLGGIGGYGLLQLLPAPADAASSMFALVAVSATIATAHGRGLPGLISGQSLIDEREQALPHAERPVTPAHDTSAEQESH